MRRQVRYTADCIALDFNVRRVHLSNQRNKAIHFYNFDFVFR
jgi:hypothetical protein